MRRLLWICAAIAMLAGCSERDPETLFAPDSGTLVIDLTLLVDKPFGDAFLTETRGANEVFDPNAGGVSGAVIVVEGGPDRLTYFERRPGVYSAALSSALVQQATTYTLNVSLPDGRTMGATTTTPAPFSMDRWVLLDDAGQSVTRDLVKFAWPGDTTVYNQNQLVYAEGLLEAWFAPTIQPGYQAALFSLDLDSPLIIDPDFIDQEDLDDLERKTSTPALEDDEGKIRLPWFTVFYEGRYKIRIYTLDRNWFDYVRSDPAAGGGGFGGNAGDGFENPIFHVEGGIGLFGSAAVDSVGVTFLPRP